MAIMIKYYFSNLGNIKSYEQNRVLAMKKYNIINSDNTIRIVWCKFAIFHYFYSRSVTCTYHLSATKLFIW